MCLTMQEVFSQHRGACPGLTYHRVPVPDFCAPREEVRGPGRRGLWGGRGGSPHLPSGLGLGYGHGSAEGLGACSTRVQIWWFISIPSKLGVLRVCVFVVSCRRVSRGRACPWCVVCVRLLQDCLEWVWVPLWSVYMCVACIFL